MKNVILSKKLTFSLTSLVIMLVFGFALMPVMAHTLDPETDPAHTHIGPTPAPDLSITDVSEADGNQLEMYGALPTPFSVGANAGLTAGQIDTQAEINAIINGVALIADKNIEFFIRLTEGYARLNTGGANVAITDDEALHISDITVDYYDIDGQLLGVEDYLNRSDGADPPGRAGSADSNIMHRNTAFPDGRNFVVTIAQADIPANARYMTAILEMDQFEHAYPPDVRRSLITANASLAMNAGSNELRFELVNAEPDDMDAPNVVSIVRVVSTAAAATSRFTQDSVDGPFNVRVTFTEEPNFDTNDNGTYNIDELPFGLENATITRIVKGMPFYSRGATADDGAPAGIHAPDPNEGNYLGTTDDVPLTTGRDAKYHPYLLSLTPTLTSDADVVIRVQAFNDMVIPANRYRPPSNIASTLNRSVLRVPVDPLATTTDVQSRDAATEANRDGRRGNEVFIGGGQIVPAGGYLVLARGADEATSGVKSVTAEKYKDTANDDGTPKREPADNLTAIDRKYNVNYGVAFPASDLALFFRNGGTIELRYNDAPKNTVDKSANKTGYDGARTAEGITEHSLVISEIMWGTDNGKADMQWIELYNPGPADLSIDPNEWILRFNGTTPVIDSKFATVVDTAGNDTGATGFVYWEVVGSSGEPVSQTNPEEDILTSMFLKIDGDTVPDGTSAESWMASPVRPVINVVGDGIGTPGAATPYTAPVVTVTETPPTPPPDVATAGDLSITEIMVASNGGRLPQWIEITNGSAGEVGLDGWVLGIDNDPADANVTPALGIKLDGVTLGAGQSLLVISKTGRNSGVGMSKGDIREDRILNAATQVKPPDMTYMLLSDIAFRIALEPPLPVGGATDRGDVVGNLGGGWAIPMSEEGRSSIIRRETNMGTEEAGWALAPDSAGYVGTYYGNADDRGTPGYDTDGPLPVELSKFSAARDRVTGQVTITWETQSELNNAGFFVKRSQQRNGQFVVVNPTMVPGAGTTSEKQSYTYTDTTAKPNIVYYYQIEDVSLDGNRQTLTRGHRLKGHIGAAGKATTTWGELKTSRTQ